VRELPDVVQEMQEGCRLALEISESINRWVSPASEVSDDLPTSIDPMPVIRYVLKVCMRVVAKGRGRLSYDGSETLPQVKITWAELAQVLINLVSNAGQALQEEKRPQGEVVITASPEDAEVRFVVRDNGPGMPPDVLEKAGTPFYSRRPKGTGLGISQCKRLIEGSGGELRIESELGVGTSVFFTVPIDR
jgi:signal transduction histidine kinase